MFLSPKPKYNVTLKAKVTQDTMVVFKEYAQYTGLSMDEMFVAIADKLLEDNDFIDSVKQKRSNKRIMEVLSKKQMATLTSLFQVIEEDDDSPFEEGESP